MQTTNTIGNNITTMEELTIIMLIMAVLFYLASAIVRRKEMEWIAMIVSVCGFCSVLIDPMFDTDPQLMLLLIIPYAYIVFMSALKVSGVVKGGRN